MRWAGSSAPGIHGRRSMWVDRNTPGDNPKQIQDTLSSVGYLRHYKPRITRDMKLQTGKLDEPIISPVLTLMSQHPATSLTFLESWKCYPTGVSLIRTDGNGTTPPSWSAELCCRGLFRWGRLHPLSSWHCSGWPVAQPTSWWPTFRKR